MPNSYLSSNTGTATNAKKFTLSMWIKRGNLCDSNSQRFYQGYKDGNDRFYVMFDNTSSNPDTLWIYAVTGGTVQLYWTSARKFRDTNGWYHFVFSADSTLGTAADRLKVYVNGVLETSFTKNNNPSQNIDWGNQLAQTNGDLTISGTESQTQHFDGYMSHVAFVDGQALAPTEFGETDSTSGTWKFKAPSGITWGDNGYHLKFENSGNMGLDSSGEGNNFTVNGNLKQAVDTPSNVYATWQKTFWIAATLSNGNTTIQTQGNGNYAFNPASLGFSKGKWYWENKIVTNAQSDMFGISGRTEAGGTQNELGHHSDQYAFNSYSGVLRNNDSDTSYTSAFATNGNIVQIAVDVDNLKIYLGINGTWQNSADPANGTGGLSIGALSTTTDGFYYPAIGDFSSSAGTYDTNFGNGFFGTTAITSAGSNGNGSLFEYDVPSGFYAVNTKNINTYG